MKIRTLLLPLMGICLLSTSINSQVVQSANGHIYPSLYYTQAELVNLNSLKIAPSHIAIWNSIKSWANSHINDLPPAEPTDQSQGTWMNTADSIRRYVETMSFMYHMTDDPTYANAARNWLLSISDWTNWTYPERDWQVLSWMGMAFACGYYDFYYYLAVDERQTIREKMVTELSVLYDDYAPFGQTYFPSTYPNHESLVASSIGLAALALGDDYSGSSDWLNFALDTANHVLSLGDRDGGWIEGVMYFNYSMDALVQFLDALKRVNGRDLFIAYRDFLANAPFYLIYMTYNQFPLQMEDCVGNNTLFNNPDVTHCFVYRLAKEYGNVYAQSYANGMAKQYFMQSYIWKDPNLLAVAIANLPLNRYFRDIGYVIWRSGWSDTDVLFLFKSGTSQGHAHPSQNEYLIYENGLPITGGPGYITGWDEYDQTWTHNCLLVDGLGQAQEPGDLGTAPLGTRGVIQEVKIDPNYLYVRGDASATYTNNENLNIYLRSGDLKKWIRNVVFIKNPNYFVIYDDVAAPTPKQFDWLFQGLNIDNENANLSINNDLLTYVKGNDRLEIKVLEPIAFNYEIIHDNGPFGRDWDYIKLRPKNNVSSTRFLTLLFPDNSLTTGAVSTERVAQGNCIGEIVSYGDNKDLILFSADGNPVDQSVALGNAYQSADGNNYVFTGTHIEAKFNTYQVMRLVKQNQPPILVGIGDRLINESQSLEFTISATDPDGDTLTYSASNLPSGASFDPSIHAFSWTPNYTQAGVYSDIYFEVSDGVLTDNELITITVNQSPRYIVVIVVAIIAIILVICYYFYYRSSRYLAIK